MELGAVSRTAIGVARVRARESARADRLFDDPYAGTFAALGEQPTEVPSPARLAIAFQIIIRTRFYDDWLAAQTTAGVRQVVLLGAGLDTRAYRLRWPEGTRLYELDLPAVLEVKDRLLAEAAAEPTCDRLPIPADVTGEWLPALETAGFDAGVPTAWLAEGLLVYLDEQQAAHVLDVATQASAPGSAFATERTSGAAARLAAPDTQATTDLWQGGLGERIDAFLEERGWQVEVHLLSDVAERVGRPMSRRSESGFLTATR
jgi:methyltransferase (TIGR00027 family)